MSCSNFHKIHWSGALTLEKALRKSLKYVLSGMLYKGYTTGRSHNRYHLNQRKVRTADVLRYDNQRNSATSSIILWYYFLHSYSRDYLADRHSHPLITDKWFISNTVSSPGRSPRILYKKKIMSRTPPYKNILRL